MVRILTMSGDLMERVSRAHLTWKRRIARDLLPYGINPKQIFLLRTLAAGPLTPSRVADLLHADRPSATSMLGTLERAGWITRRPDPDNGKQVLVEITARGRRKLASVPEALWRTGKTTLDPAARLSTSERRELARLLEKLQEGLDDPDEPDDGDEPAPRDGRFSDAALERLARAQYRRGDAGFALDPARTALVLIDMQEEFVTERGGPYRVPEAARRVPAMRRLLDGFRARGLPVLHTAFAATHGFRDRPRLGALMPNRAPDAGFDDADLFREARFVPELAPVGDEVVILKPSYGAFYDTPLQTILERAGVENVVLAGTLTDCCVGTTARQAYERGFGAVVASDATATSLPEMHDAELSVLRRSFARVLTVDDILAALPLRARRAVSRRR